MKKLLLLLLTILSFSIKAQDGQLAIELLEHVAYENARSLWGDVHPDNPIPLYNLNDQLIAYTVNFSIGEPFPERESLAESCDLLSKTADKHSRWQIGSFGHMLISATSATIPIVRYSMTVSDEYAYGTHLEQLAMDYLETDNVSLERIYLMSDLIKWYCFASSEGKAYVKIFPPVEVYSEDGFKNLVPEKYNYARLLYSTNGGSNWTVITSSTPNTGKYDWRIPSWLSSTSRGRVKVEVRQNTTGVLLASDGSWGNFNFVAGGSLPALTHDVVVNTTNVPHYYQFTNTGNYWNVVGIRRNNTTDDWDIELHGSTSFNNIIAQSTYAGALVDFVVMGDNTPVAARGIKAVRYSGSGTARVEFEGGTDAIAANSPVTGNWPAGDVVKIWDVYLTPGTHSFYLDINSGSADLDFALYGKDSSPYYAGRNAYKAISSSGGQGVNEQFTYNVTTAGWYGLCVWANNANSANFTLKVEAPGTWKGLVNTNWHTAGNWSAGVVPDASINVTIPSGTPYEPYIYTANAHCNNMTINTGATLIVGGHTLNVNSNFTINGTLAMNNSSGYDQNIKRFFRQSC